MSEEQDEIDQILDSLDPGPEATKSGDEPTVNQTESESTPDRLERLYEAGAITAEEYDVLSDHISGDDNNSHKAAKFGQPLVTSEGTDMDFSIIGVFENVNTSKLTNPAFVDMNAYDDVDMPTDNMSGPGRTVVCWQIHNHSSGEIKLKHKHIEYIGENQISYRRDENPLQVNHFGPGWRMENWEDITPETRIQYVTSIEIPNRLNQIKIDGYCSDVHSIDITEDMFFQHAELPVKTDL